MNKTIEQAHLIARFDLGTAIKTKKAFISLLVYIGLALLVAVIWCFVQNKITTELGIAEQLKGSKDQIAEIAKQQMGYDSEQVKHLFDLPPALMVFFWLTQSFLPILIAVISSDMINREIGTRAARFVLLRTSRTSLFLGKVLSHGAIFVIATVLSWTVFVGYISIFLKGFDTVSAIPHALAFLGFTLIVGFCYLGLTALVSSIIDRAGIAVLVVIGTLLTMGVVSQIDYIGWLSPSWFRNRLWSPYTLVVLSGVGAYIAFGLVFFVGAWGRTVRRDV